MTRITRLQEPAKWRISILLVVFLYLLTLTSTLDSVTSSAASERSGPFSA